MLDHLTVCFERVPNSDSTVEGHMRNSDLRRDGQVTYQQLGRIKNFFDNHTGTPQDAPFILNGESKMRDFVNSSLSGARQSLATSKNIRQDTGMEKEFVQTPNANVNLNISKDGANKTSLEKYDLQVTESLKRINNIMKKII